MFLAVGGGGEEDGGRNSGFLWTLTNYASFRALMNVADRERVFYFQDARAGSFRSSMKIPCLRWLSMKKKGLVGEVNIHGRFFKRPGCLLFFGLEL